MAPPRKSTVSKARTRRPAKPALPSGAQAREFSRRLRAWYRRHARDLPWRRTRNAYHVLVSELMLQQTQVSRVLDFYARFIARFPDLASLSAARESHVLAQWSGLGYYARARNLHKLARRVVREEPARYGGDLPSEAHELRALPGVGAYTAGAVASFAYEKRAALVDTNVARVLHRYFAPSLHPKRARDLTRLWAIAESILPRTGRAVWTHNQALMELGALVCTARIARCSECPLAATCRTNRNSDSGIGTRIRNSKRIKERE
jgi:A/G-specific adenine glycosylase